METGNWILSLYDADDNQLGQFIIKDRTEKEATNEAASQVHMMGQTQEVEDWTLMPEEFWIEQGVDTSEIEEL